jgi:hypothetical protein
MQTTDDLIDIGQKVCVKAGTAYANYLATVKHSQRGESFGGLLDRCEGRLGTWSLLPEGARKCKYDEDALAWDEREYIVKNDDGTCRRLLHHSARMNRVAPNLQEMAEKVATGACSALIDVDVLTEYVTATPQFCPLLHTSGPMFWSQNLGIGVNKGLKQFAAGLSEHLAKFRNNGFLEQINAQYFLKATCGDNQEARQLGATDFLPLFSLTGCLGVFCLLLEFRGKRIFKRYYFLLFKTSIRRTFKPRDTEELAIQMRPLFEAHSDSKGGKGAGLYQRAYIYISSRYPRFERYLPKFGPPNVRHQSQNVRLVRKEFGESVLVSSVLVPLSV